MLSRPKHANNSLAQLDRGTLHSEATLCVFASIIPALEKELQLHGAFDAQKGKDIAYRARKRMLLGMSAKTACVLDEGNDSRYL